MNCCFYISITKRKNTKGCEKISLVFRFYPKYRLVCVCVCVCTNMYRNILTRQSPCVKNKIAAFDTHTLSRQKETQSLFTEYDVKNLKTLRHKMSLPTVKYLKKFTHFVTTFSLLFSLSSVFNIKIKQNSTSNKMEYRHMHVFKAFQCI